MFTGIVTDVGRLHALVANEGSRRIVVQTTYDTGGLAIGASVSHAGCCLTVVETGPDWIATEVSNETLARTTLGDWKVGAGVNLERALKLGDEVGGHLVSGHVDGVGEVLSVSADGDSWRIGLRAPRPLHRYIAPKGSITVDGVALTVNGVDQDRFDVNLIPHTWAVTTLNTLAPGMRVNLEIDLIARYAARWRETAEG